MLATILAAFKELLGSKKFQTAVIGVVASKVCSKLGCDPATATNVLHTTWGLIGAQGLADFGKHRPR